MGRKLHIDLVVPRQVMDAFNEGAHPRSHGQFTGKGGSHERAAEAHEAAAQQHRSAAKYGIGKASARAATLVAMQAAHGAGGSNANKHAQKAGMASRAKVVNHEKVAEHHEAAAREHRRLAGK